MIRIENGYVMRCETIETNVKIGNVPGQRAVIYQHISDPKIGFVKVPRYVDEDNFEMDRYDFGVSPYFHTVEEALKVAGAAI